MKLAALALGAVAIAAPSAAMAGSLNGAGASFPAPIYQKWFQDYATKTGNQVNYQAVGSGAGVRQYKAGLPTSVRLTKQFLTRNLLASPVLWFRSL